MRIIITISILFVSIVSWGGLDSLSIQDNTLLEIKDAKELFKKESDTYDKYSSGVIALVTVVISLIISVWQARKTVKANRDNSISEARIEWIQKLRPIMGELISNISVFEYELKKRVRANDKAGMNRITADERLMELLKQLNLSFNEIKLFLNHDEPEHKVFIGLVDDFIEQCVQKTNGKETKGEVVEDDLIVAARKILKDAWEQAKK